MIRQNRTKRKIMIYRDLRLKKLVATIIIIILNIGFYIYSLNIDGNPWTNFGISWLLVEKGEWWRAITSIFSHGSFTHILFNMISLFGASMYIEPVTGPLLYSLLYLICGVGGSILGSWLGFMFGSDSISVGASGAVFGLFGILFVFCVKKIVQNVDLIRVLLLLAVSLSDSFSDSGVDLFGHIAGLIVGVIVALAYAAVSGLMGSRRYKRSLTDTQKNWRNEMWK